MLKNSTFRAKVKAVFMVITATIVKDLIRLFIIVLVEVLDLMELLIPVPFIIFINFHFINNEKKKMDLLVICLIRIAMFHRHP